MKSNYFEKRENRIEKFKILADKNATLSVASYNRAHQLGSVIPFGQPILVGHHSEGRHRAHIKKIDNAMRASIQADEKEKYYLRRLAAAESNHVISSDHPDALKLLQEKLESMQSVQELYKSINKIVKSKKLPEVEKVNQLMALGMGEKTAIELTEPDRYGRYGIPSYRLTNNNGNMARVKDRIAGLEKLASMVEKEQEIGGVKIVSSPDKNRVQIFFPGKPAEAIRTMLKRNGFRWAPSEGAWQKNLSSWAEIQAQDVVNEYSKALNQTTI